jgi:transposase
MRQRCHACNMPVALLGTECVKTRGIVSAGDTSLAYMGYILGEDRRQTQLLPATVEEYVAAASAVRVIEAFVEVLELVELGFLTAPADTGRPSYHPAVLLKLYLYGYLQRIRSSRRLEAECHRNLEVMWLLGNLRPDHWTIAAFRREHQGRFKAVLREFNLKCRQLELFGAELVAIDGAKFKAVNSPKRHWSAEQIAELMAQIDTRIEAYVEQLDAADEATADVAEQPSAEELVQKLAQLQQWRAQKAELQNALECSGQNEVSLTDPDSRGQQKVGVGYNVQIAVDAKHHLIAAETVEQAANDSAQLQSMAHAAQTEIGATSIVADAGYHERGQLLGCEQAGLTTYVPAPTTRSGQTAGGQSIYPKERFTYGAPQDAYRCPAGKWLPRAGGGEKHGKACAYYYDAAACTGCLHRSACTTAPYRKLSRLENEEVVERQAARVAAHPEFVRQRKEIVEHVFGTMRQWGHDEFLCRGLAMVRAEFSLTALAYNLRRAINVCGTQALLRALQPA